MKKTLLFLAAISMAVAANAKILRVSNVSGSSAPYTSISAAHDAASAGDTIMLDSSPTRYDDFTVTLTKKVVLLGPGYWLVQNGMIEEGASTATIHTLVIKATETVVKGVHISSGLKIQASKVVINRCHINDIDIAKSCDNAVISQSFIVNKISGGNYSNYHQITNNIFINTSTFGHITGVNDCYIAYNTCRSAKFESNATNSTFENNLWKEFNDKGSNNSVKDNYQTDIISTQATNDFIDSDYYKLEIPEDVISKYGAFAGDSPYIMSGVPSGPIITDLVVPTTVETGSKMNVTIKVEMIK